MPETACFDDLIARYDQSVPRYTSYPTAVQFRPVDHDGDRWLFEATGPLSLYIHIPFCRTLCHYCGCNTKTIKRREPIDRYLDYLHREIALVGQTIGRKLPVSQIHFGGGTPNVLEGEDIAALLASLHDYFVMDGVSEIAMEMDPRQLTEEKIADYAVCGISRVSLGVQDFHPEVQQAIRRVQPYDQIVRAVQELRRYGIDHINFDLIYGLPLQTIESIENNMEQAVHLQPDRIALFGYAHVPWFKPHQQVLENYPMADGRERFAMAMAARKRLLAKGYKAVGIDHFCKPDDSLYLASLTGKLFRNFQGYTTDDAETLIGLGSSAISRLPSGFRQNAGETREYYKMLDNDRMPVIKHCPVDNDDRMRGVIIERLMCDFRVNLTEICMRFGKSVAVLQDAVSQLFPLERDGLVRTMRNNVIITEHGQPFARVVAACFDRYRQQGETRHARAV